MLPDALRQHMAVTDHYAYFNHAAVSPLPVPARDVMHAYLDDRVRFGAQRLDAWEGRIAEARARMARLINVAPEHVTITRNTSFGLNIVANGLSWQAGDNVVVPESEFVANVYVWRNLERLGVTVRFVPAREGRIFPEDVEAAIDERTRLLAVSFVEFQTGFRNDLAALKEISHRRGVPICVDAIQGLGVLPLDASALELDFVATGAPKFLMGPIGVGFLYIRPDWLDRLDRTVSGWMGTVDPENYFSYDLPFRNDALRYEEGSHSVALVMGWNESLRLLLEVGIENIAAHVRLLTDHLIEGLQRLERQVVTPHAHWEERAAIVSFVPRSRPERLARALNEAGFAVSQRGDVIRIAPHGYNTLDEVSALLAAIERLDREEEG